MTPYVKNVMIKKGPTSILACSICILRGNFIQKNYSKTYEAVPYLYMFLLFGFLTTLLHILAYIAFSLYSVQLLVGKSKFKGNVFLKITSTLLKELVFLSSEYKFHANQKFVTKVTYACLKWQKWAIGTLMNFCCPIDLWRQRAEHLLKMETLVNISFYDVYIQILKL